MTDLKGQHISAIALGFLLLASTAKSANAQIRIDKDQTGRIVAMANLSTASGCSRASGRGRVIDHHFENGQMKGVTFKDAKHGESYGVHAENVTFDHAAVIDRKNKVVKTLVSGVGFTMKSHKVKVYKGEGKVLAKTADGFEIVAPAREESLHAAAVRDALERVARRTRLAPSEESAPEAEWVVHFVEETRRSE